MRGWQPLHHAANNGRVEVTRKLISANADIWAITKIGDTPFHMAVRARDFEIIEVLANAVEEGKLKEVGF